MFRLAFRVDAADWIGSGHAVRCATLARRMAGQGTEVFFFSREHKGHYCDWLERQGFQVRRMRGAQAPLGPVGTGSQAGWLGVSLEEELGEFLPALATAGRFDWLVVDHYALGAEWERAARLHSGRLVVIDDLADRAHDCDLLLDHNVAPEAEARYRALMPARARLLLGPRFALLQPEYAAWRERMPPRGGPVRRILVFFGGSDPANLTGRTLAALRRLDRVDVRIDVVAGGNYARGEALAALAAGMPNVSLHRDLPSLAPLMAAADLAVGAGGATTWERCCLGLPSLVVTVAANQVPNARELDARGLIRWIGSVGEIDDAALERVLARALAEGIGEECGRQCRELVDGRGAARVAAALEADAAMPLTLRDARADDEQLLLEWANDPIVRGNGFSSARIEREGHHAWFSAHLNEPGRNRICVAETATGVPIGQVRFELGTDGWRIGYSLDAAFRGVGLGGRLLEAAIRRHVAVVGACSLVGRVRPANAASRRVFERLGFAADHLDDEVIEYRLAAAPHI